MPHATASKSQGRKKAGEEDTGAGPWGPISFRVTDGPGTALVPRPQHSERHARDPRGAVLRQVLLVRTTGRVVQTLSEL